MRSTFLLVAVSLAFATVAHARPVRLIGTEELFAKSDLIVIAEPLTRSRDTNERTHLPGIFENTGSGQLRPIPAVGVETTFKVCHVVKGDSHLSKFTLHHLREASASFLTIDGPQLVQFAASTANCTQRYLLFLLREEDGRYVPYGGQSDPSGISIFKLDNVDAPPRAPSECMPGGFVCR
jgi:hypothetical protein